MTSTTTYHANKAANMTKQCSSPGCMRLRLGLDATCSTHRDARRRMGHPSAKPLAHCDWAAYATAIEHLFGLNSGHAGLLEAERFVDGFMKRGIANRSAFKGAGDMQRLATHGVTARSVLVTFLAVLEYQRHYGHRSPDDRARDFELSRAVFALAPQDVKPGWRGTRGRPYRGRSPQSALSFVGKYLRISLAEFFATVSQGLEAQAKAKSLTAEQRRAALTAPMVVSLA